MTKQQGPRFNVLRDGEPIAKNVGLTKAKDLIKQGKEDFASSNWVRVPVGETPKPSPDNGIPDFCKIPQEQRNATWEKNPPKAVPAFERPARVELDADKVTRERILAEQAEAKKTAANVAKGFAKAFARISKMKARAEEGKPGPGMRWDTRTSRFVPEHVLATKSNPVEEVAMAKKAKATKKKVSGEPRPGSKTAIVAALLRRKDGCTSTDAFKAVGWKTIGVPFMEKAMGVKIKKEKLPGKPLRYYIA